MILTILRIAFIVGVAVALAKGLEFAVQRWLSGLRSPLASSGIFKALIWGVVFSIAFLTILTELGIQIGPLITALGVGGLAAALAVRDTLENLFSGISLLVDRSLNVGDRVRLEIGQEGVIEDIGWRTSRLIMDSGDTIIIPNAKLIQGVNIRKKPA